AVHQHATAPPAAVDRTVAVPARPHPDVVALTARDRIVPDAADEPVSAGAAHERVVARAAHESVIARAALEPVVAAAPDEGVVAGASEKRELACGDAAAVDDVVAGSGIHDGVGFQISERDAIVATEGVHAHVRAGGKRTRRSVERGHARARGGLADLDDIGALGARADRGRYHGALD